MGGLSIKDFRRALRRLQVLFANQQKDAGCCCGISFAQCHLLLEIQDLVKTNTGELASRLGLDKSTVSRTVDAMVSTGLVKRSEDPEDRRFTMIELTQRGRNTAGEIDDINNKYYESAFKGMDGKEIDLMFQHLQSLVDTLEQVEKGRKT